MKAEATADLLPQAEQASLDELLRQIDGYQDTKAGKIFGKLARKAAKEPNDINPMGDKLVLSGLYLLHSSLHTGDQRFPFRTIGDTHLVDLSHNSGIVDEQFVGEIDSAVKNSDAVIAKHGKKAVQGVSKLYPVWAEKLFGVEPDEEFARIMFDAPPIVAVWDHNLANRKLFGEIWGIPPKTDSPTYTYWKMSEFPPSFFLSDKFANDSRQYVEKLARDFGQSRQEVLNLSVAHERMHRVATSPVNDLIIPQVNNWWSEAVAITYTDLPNYQKRVDTQTRERQDVDATQIMSAQGGVNYKGSLSLWLALSSMETGSYDPEKLYQGSDGLIEKMVDLAHQGQTIQPPEIPAKLFPTIEETSILNEANARRLIMLGLLQQSAFA